MHSPECNLVYEKYVLSPSNVLCTSRTFLDHWRTFMRGFFVTYRRCTLGLEDRSWLILTTCQERSWVAFLHSQECSWLILTASTERSSGAPALRRTFLRCILWRAILKCILVLWRAILVAPDYICGTFFRGILHSR